MRINQLLCYGLVARAVCAFSFRQRSENQETVGPRHNLNISPIEVLQSSSRPSDIYAIALSELQDLESEPLCHRIAARLLIGNCQLLDGKDEATILTDSGRQIRDFVDSYAASMAICDLERGRFKISQACEKFREVTLTQLPLVDGAHLHVTSHEIDLCLAGLAADNSAWSTWVSYRHKALRFCEAARADQEKAQNILLYQRLTKVMAKLTRGVEIDIQKHMDNLELLAQKAGDTIQSMEPELDRLRNKLISIEDYFTGSLERTLKKSGDTVDNGLKNAADLQRMLTAMIQTALEGTSQVAVAQEKSIQMVEQNSVSINNWADVVVTAAASAVALNNQLEISRLETQELIQQQEGLSVGLERLRMAADSLSSMHYDHARALGEAKNTTAELLDTLDGIAASTAIIKDASHSLFRSFDISSWIPYIISPVATLLLGSYGLTPSALRNLGLVALGEIVGFWVSHLDTISMAWVPFYGHALTSNTTTAPL